MLGLYRPLQRSLEKSVTTISKRKLFKATNPKYSERSVYKAVKDYNIQSVQSEPTFCRKYIYMLKSRLPITYCVPLSQKGHVQARLLHLRLSVKKLELVLPELIEANKITEPLIASTRCYFQTDRKREIDAGLILVILCFVR